MKSKTKEESGIIPKTKKEKYLLTMAYVFFGLLLIYLGLLVLFSLITNFDTFIYKIGDSPIRNPIIKIVFIFGFPVLPLFSFALGGGLLYEAYNVWFKK